MEAITRCSDAVQQDYFIKPALIAVQIVALGLMLGFLHQSALAMQGLNTVPYKAIAAVNLTSCAALLLVSNLFEAKYGKDIPHVKTAAKVVFAVSIALLVLGAIAYQAPIHAIGVYGSAIISGVGLALFCPAVGTLLAHKPC